MPYSKHESLFHCCVNTPILRLEIAKKTSCLSHHALNCLKLKINKNKATYCISTRQKVNYVYMSIVDIKKYLTSCTFAKQQLMGNMSQFYILSKVHVAKQKYMFLHHELIQRIMHCW